MSLSNWIKWSKADYYVLFVKAWIPFNAWYHKTYYDETSCKTDKDMIIKASAAIRQNYNEISELCKTSKEPVYLTKNGEGDLVVMDIDTFTRREKMLKLREKLLSVEENRLHGSVDCSIEDLDRYLESVIEDVANGSKQAV